MNFTLPNTFSNDFGDLSLENNPLGFTSINSINGIYYHNDLQDHNSEEQNVTEFFMNKNCIQLDDNEKLTKDDIQDFLKSINNDLKNININNSNLKTEYITSRPLPHISEDQYFQFKSTNQEHDLNALEQKISEFSTSSSLKSIIGPFSPLDQLIELTYKLDFKAVDQMIAKREAFIYKIFKYRKVKGDGNCFYRAIIFSFIENIILEKNRQLLINLIYDIKSCYDTPVILSKLNIPNGIVLNYKLAISILIIIEEYLKVENVDKAYEIYIKCILSCPHFDYSLILYMRFILYRFIKDNKEKFYTKEFPVVLGNLLPSEYETEDGKFLFEQFYENYLLKMFKDAEKIVIYLTPFVLCTQLNVELFDMNEDSLKIFNYNGENNHKADFIFEILNNKIHYEIIYSKDKYDRHQRIFNNYKMSKEYINIVMPEIIKTNCDLLLLGDLIGEQQPKEQQQKQQGEVIVSLYPKPKEENKTPYVNQNTYTYMSKQDNTQCLAYNNKSTNKTNDAFVINSIPLTEATFDYDYFTNKQKKPDKTICNEVNDINNIFAQPQEYQCQSARLPQSQSQKEQLLDVKPINTSTQIFPTCISCKKDYLEKNIFNLCMKCLIEEIKTNFLIAYLKFLPQSKCSIEQSKRPDIAMEMFYSSFQTRKIIIQNKELTAEDAKFFINYNKSENKSIYDIISDFKKTLCVSCEKNIVTPLMQLPCGCSFCSSFCCSEFFKKYKLLTEKDYICVCGKTCELDQLPTLAALIAPYKKNRAEDIIELFQKKIKNKCLRCVKDIRNPKDLVPIKCKGMSEEFTRHFGDISIIHAICSECIKVVKKQDKCSICHTNHVITKDEGCSFQ